MRQKKHIVFFILMLALVFLDTTLLKSIRIGGVHPDILLVILVFASHSCGALCGVSVGFFSGILIDLLSTSPFGFYGIIFAVIAYLFGKTKGNIFLDPILFPLLMLLFATLIKFLLSFLLLSVFLPERSEAFFAFPQLIQIALNMVMAPFFYAVLKAFGLMSEHEREGF